MSKHPQTTEHNYIKKVAAWLATHTNGNAHVEVQHDDWCNALTGKANGLCNCDPTLVPYDT